MGAGTYGGFGHTLGSAERNRLGHPVTKTEKTLEMSLNPAGYAHLVAEKYNIHLRAAGHEVRIIFNPNLPPGVYGRTSYKNPFVIEIGPSALTSEKELANTIAHELNHARSFARGGSAPESTAYASGDALADYIGGRR